MAERPPSGREPLELHGPLCDCQIPTVLKTLNGRNIYVCARYPMHHCSKWCPADVLLVDDDQPHPAPSPFAEPPQAQIEAAAQPAIPSPQEDDNEMAIGSPPVNAAEAVDEPMPASPPQPDNNDDDNYDDVDDNHRFIEGTPPSELSHPPAQPPAAPTKSYSHGSVTSRNATSNVKRSLAPHFNLYASRLGGRFVTLRPTAQSIVQMQRKMSGKQSADLDAALKTPTSKRVTLAIEPKPAAPTRINPTTTTTTAVAPVFNNNASHSALKKRSRNTADGGGMSIKTVSFAEERPLNLQQQRGQNKGDNTTSVSGVTMPAHKLLRRM